MIKRLVERMVDLSIRRPLEVVLFSLILIASAGLYIRARLELRSDFRELLPRDSPAFIAFESQLARVGGGASLLVVVESPDRGSNERFIDALAKRTEAIGDERKACLGKGGSVERCGPELVSYVESGTKEVRKFFQDNKWLYADLAELEDADRTLDNQIAIRTGMVSDLEGDDDLDSPRQKKAALGMDEHKKKWDDQANKHDDFPTGYFATPDGTMMAIRVVSPTTGTGDRGGDILLQKVQAIVGDLQPKTFHAEARVGYAGDIPNAIAEKESIASEAAWATILATVLIVSSVVAFFRSFSAVIIMLLPVLLGIGCAYSFATATFGYVNTSGAFLGAIILGNGINYPIVLLARHREFVARGMPTDVAKKAAVWNAFRAELVGASVAGIAYGSLVLTRFRGFSQFGTIGFVGMLLVWLSIIPLVPAMITLVERARRVSAVASTIQKRDRFIEGSPLRVLFSEVKEDGTRGGFVAFAAKITETMPKVLIALAVVLTVLAAVKIPGFLKDPWEYNFARLGSRGTKYGGAGEWSLKAEKVFGGKMNIAGALMLGDTPEQTLELKKQILENDKRDPQGRVVGDISTVYDVLPGTTSEQKEKLAVLDRIRERLTPRVLHDMPDDERKRLEEMRPPETLKVLAPTELPSLLRRRFEEKNGTVGTAFYVKFDNDLSLSDGHNMLRIAKTTDNVRLPDGTSVKTASRSTIFAEMIRSMERDGPLASFASFGAVCIVVLFATASFRGFVCTIVALLLGVIWMLGGVAWLDMKLNFLNFIALPITFGIGSEYPFNLFDRSRLLGNDVTLAVRRSGGAVALCSLTTVIGYGSLVFADNQALQSFGKIAMSGELTCLGAAMFVLPALLHVWKAPRGQVAAEHGDR